MKSTILNLGKEYIIYFLLALGIFSSCETVTEPVQPQLVIYNGYYLKIGDTPQGIKYVYGFNCVSRGTDCIIGGYNINWNNGFGGGLLYYSAKYLYANVVYCESDTVLLAVEIKENPIVKMSGNLPNDSKEYSYLKAECQMRNK